MRNKLLFLLFFLISAFALRAQVDGISYQAVIIDNNPQEIPGVDIAANNLPNAELEVRFTIFNQNGQTEYQETHQTETDPFGMINLMIGRGDVTAQSMGAFDEIYWSDAKTLTVEIDLKDGNGFVAFSEQGLTYIPYVKHREIVATSTLDVDGATNLNSTLNVNNESTTTLSGDLYVEGTAYFSDGEFDNLVVHQNTNLNVLNVDGTSTLNAAVTVTQASPTNLTGTLNVDGSTTINNQLSVTNEHSTDLSGTLSVEGSTDLFGTLSVEGVSTLNNEVVINATATEENQNEFLAYPLRVNAGQQGVAIKLNPDNPSRANNFISFWGGTGEPKGRIEGNNGLTGIATNVVQNTIGTIPGIDDIIDQVVGEDEPAPDVAANEYFNNEYAFGAYNLTIDFVTSIIRFGINATAASGLCVAGDCDDAIWSFIDMTVDGIQLGGYLTYNEINIGVAFESGGADYAEFLEKYDDQEILTLGEVVGVKGGKVSKSFVDAEMYMVVSENPMISGAMPDAAEEYRFERIAFMGQVPVKVMGKVNRGDYILPSGNGDGMAIAVAPAAMKTGDYGRIVGIAWSAYNGAELFSYVNTAVGLNTNDLVGVVQQMQTVMNDMQKAIAETNPNYNPTYFENTGTRRGAASDQTKALTLNDQIIIDYRGKDFAQVIRENKAILEAHQFDFSLFPYLEEALDNPTKENLEQMVAFYSQVLDRAMKTAPGK